MSREGYAHNYTAEEVARMRGPGCQCSVQQLDEVGCDCRAQYFAIVGTAPDLAIEHRDPVTGNRVICLAGIVSLEAAAVFVDELVCDPTINCQDPVDESERYAAYLAAGCDGDASCGADADLDYFDPEAQADLELHDALHPFGYGIEAPAEAELNSFGEPATQGEDPNS